MEREYQAVGDCKYRFQKKSTVISPLWFVLYIIIASTVITSLLVYNSLPEQIPVRYNAEGEVIKYVEKSYGAILSIPVTQLFIMIIFIFV